ncbi:dTDP-4-dehydrorhamnose reductase [Williamsia sterculiae]|uniref:dTDP-4-dehydrorhamnose reductase n=1 Tax=Williamsia sterculiae TaxID=1344003 RepID=A0A1N7E096_9NOCA|nr:dTDP-4-dehydrorhamnose reductase [Williamsia sterculiae]SIR81537.1 dTDP-4-dehydrorhamnose reductase [Williamsia sterculiae]
MIAASSTAGETRILVTGGTGQVGRLLGARGPASVTALGSTELDITDPASVSSVLDGYGPGDVVINCAAHTDVDGAETDVERATAINVDGPRLLAEHSVRRGVWLIHLSTDYVFVPTGGAPRPWRPEDRDVDGPDPVGVYGRTKLGGEREIRAADPTATIVRTAWVYTGAEGGTDFVSTMRRLERTRDTTRVVDDQTGSPTYSVDLADALLELATTRPSTTVGAVLHATNAGSCTWFGLAREVFRAVGADPGRVQPCTTAEFPRPAPRPAYSVLSGAAWSDAGLTPLREWRAALHDAVRHAGDA